MTEEQLFAAALELPDGASRAAYLDQACGRDSELRHQVEALLASHFRSGQFLNVAAAEQLQMSNPAQTLNLPNLVTDREGLEFLAPPTRPDSLGRLGHYEVLQVLGRGGFGVVLRAYDDKLQRVVAIKVMAPQIAVTSPARKRFLREARASAAARHEHVVQIYEVGEQPLPYLVMEFIPGETLQQYLDRTGPLDLADTLRIGRQIAEGLSAAHASGLIHRDIKPGNILLEVGSSPGVPGQHRVKITDFGLARAADDASLTQSGVIAGTPLYMAPEQALGQPLDPRADLFSLGSVLYQMVAGHPPFRASTTVAALKRVAEDTPRPIREIIPETPHWLCEFIAKLHAKNPAQRYQSAQEVAAVLAAREAQLRGASVGQDDIAGAKIGQRTWLVAALLLLLVIAVAAIGPRMLGWLGDRGEIASPLNGSFGGPDAQRIAALPVAEQVAAVITEMKRRNPNWVALLSPTYDGDRVTGLDLDGREVRDISPLRNFHHLQSLSLNECWQLTDLSPLRGLPLETLGIRGWAGADLRPLQGMPLKVLNCSGQGQALDLAQLSGLPLVSLYCNTLTLSNLVALEQMPLQHLQCAESNVADLTPLRGLQLTHLNINTTSVRDLSPLAGMPLASFDCQGLPLAELKSLTDLPLVEIYCDFEFERDAPLLRTIKSLERINDEPAGDVLKGD
ncbi:protein kinase [Anatilimnocola sp. NA78]|uniref:protein kinase domain-containing protein n=1 Tax=Anatilimnocola sp. NA78 TaxID=3415683 RepID=UPI003CE4F82A